jgi:branched-chain amino acid transport system ATP-binding protein
MSLIRTDKLSCHFGGIKAVDEVDFTLDQGRIRALIGPNGAGKTTLTSLIVGRLAPTSGRIYFRETDITRMPPHKRIGLGMAYTFQITTIFEDLPVYENVLIAAQRFSKARGLSLRTEAKRMLELVGIDNMRHQRAGDMSYGHKRLLEMAMGLIQQPNLLILDEPTQGLSAGEISDFVHLIGEISHDTTVLLIEHNMDVVMALADIVTVMDQGRIIAEGHPGDIRRNDAVREAYLGT